MPFMREVDGALHISSRGQPLWVGITMLSAAAGGVLAAVNAHDGQLLIYLLSATMGLAGVLSLIAWTNHDRVMIDPRTQSIVLEETSIPWSDVAGIVLAWELVGETTEYTLWLVRARDGTRVRVALTQSERQSRKLAERVAVMLGVPLAEEQHH